MRYKVELWDEEQATTVGVATTFLSWDEAAASLAPNEEQLVPAEHESGDLLLRTHDGAFFLITPIKQ